MFREYNIIPGINLPAFGIVNKTSIGLPQQLPSSYLSSILGDTNIEPLYDPSGNVIGSLVHSTNGTSIEPLIGSGLASYGPLTSNYLYMDYTTGRPSYEIRNANGDYIGKIDPGPNGSTLNITGFPPLGSLP